MQIYIEFLGLSRLTTGEREIELSVNSGTTFQDIVRILAQRYPALLENIIQPTGDILYEPNIFNVNSQRMIQEHEMDGVPQSGDRIILMSISAGG